MDYISEETQNIESIGGNVYAFGRMIAILPHSLCLLQMLNNLIYWKNSTWGLYKLYPSGEMKIKIIFVSKVCPLKERDDNFLVNKLVMNLGIGIHKPQFKYSFLHS